MPHILLALSGHGYGHLAQSAAVINRLWERIPDLKLTVCGSLPRDIIATRLDKKFDYRELTLDPVLQMFNAWEVDVPASRDVYREFHRHREAGLQQDVALLAELAPALVFADIPYRILQAAAQAGIPTVGLCSLNWAAVYAAYCSDSDEDRRILEQIRAGYREADVFLTPAPAIPMPELDNVSVIGPIARQGRRQTAMLLERCTAGHDVKTVLVALGGIATGMPMENWPYIENVLWVFTESPQSSRPDIIDFSQLTMPFIDVLASVDIVLTKPGYGTYVEAVCNRVPVLSIERPDWVETDCLNSWVRQHGHLEVMSRDEFFTGAFAARINALLAADIRSGIAPAGIDQAADRIQSLLP